MFYIGHGGLLHLFSSFRGCKLVSLLTQTIKWTQLHVGLKSFNHKMAVICVTAHRVTQKFYSSVTEKGKGPLTSAVNTIKPV